MKFHADESSCAAKVRRTLLAVVSMTPLVASCVSAVDGTTAFGFPGDPVADAGAIAASAEAAAPSPAAETGDAGATAADAGAQVALAAQTEAGEAVRVAGEAETVEAPVSGAEALLTPASAPAEAKPAAGSLALAAYATPARQSNRSLYASLFTQSEARTPIGNAEAGKSRRVVITERQGAAAAESALPGVDPKSLFEIGQRASADDPELLEDIGGEYQIASLAGIARLAPSGLLVQRDDIVTNCFDSKLMALLGQIEAKYRKKVVITSGYRSPAHNKRVSGAKASLHMACKAADLHVPGVNGAEVARYVRSLPNRGGVGTYCHTTAVHVDVGRARDWNWACRRRKQA